MTTAVVDTAVDTLRSVLPDAPFPADAIETEIRPTAARPRARTRPPRAADPVHVATPDAALLALTAGSPVICLSPFTDDVSTARRLVETAEAAGLAGVVPFVGRYHPMVREARARIARGDLGMLLTIDGTSLQDALLGVDDPGRSAPARGGSRAFAELGAPLCDLVEFVSGHRIARLTARTRRVFARRGGAEVTGEDIATVMIETDRGALGTLVVSQMAPGRADSLTLDLRGTAQSLGFASARPGELSVGTPAGVHVVREDAARGRAENAFDAFLAAASAVADPHPPRDLPTLRDGLRAATLAAAVVESAARGVWVETPHGPA